MTQDSLARDLSASGDLSDDPVYDALVAALRSNARGRAFLDEYARRARAADTGAALQALARIEALLTKEHAAVAALVADVQAIEPGDAQENAQENSYVPFEIDFPPNAGRAAQTPDALEMPVLPPPRYSSADLLTQVMALSPEERIALFS